MGTNGVRFQAPNQASLATNTIELSRCIGQLFRRRFRRQDSTLAAASTTREAAAAPATGIVDILVFVLIGVFVDSAATRLPSFVSATVGVGGFCDGGAEVGRQRRQPDEFGNVDRLVNRLGGGVGHVRALSRGEIPSVDHHGVNVNE